VLILYCTRYARHFAKPIGPQYLAKYTLEYRVGTREERNKRKIVSYLCDQKTKDPLSGVFVVLGWRKKEEVYMLARPEWCIPQQRERDSELAMQSMLFI